LLGKTKWTGKPRQVTSSNSFCVFLLAFKERRARRKQKEDIMGGEVSKANLSTGFQKLCTEDVSSSEKAFWR
jgi:hypothetical protein